MRSEAPLYCTERGVDMKGARLIASCTAIILLLFLIPFSVFANSAPIDHSSYIFYLKELPQGTAYVDLLIPFEENDEMYSTLNANNLPASFSRDSQIVTYCRGGYRSYTFHYKDAESSMEVSQKGYVEFFNTRGNFSNGRDHKEYVERLGKIRLAMLDEKGDILQVSQVLPLRSRRVFSTLTGSFRYNGRTDSFSASYTSGFWDYAGYFLMAFACLVFTCISEYLVAIPFGVTYWHGKTVVAVNIVSQLLMHLLYIILYGLLLWRYAVSVLVLELLVFAGECWYYTRKLDTVPRKKRILYGITANAVSLIIGYLVILPFVND